MSRAAPRGPSLCSGDCEHLRPVMLGPGPSCRWCEWYIMITTGQVTGSLTNIITCWIFPGLSQLAIIGGRNGQHLCPTLPDTFQTVFESLLPLFHSPPSGSGGWDKWPLPATQCPGWLPADLCQLLTSQLRLLPARYPTPWNMPKHDRFLERTEFTNNIGLGRS